MHKNLEKMKYRIKKETKPKLPTYGKYKAVAVHNQICDTPKGKTAPPNSTKTSSLRKTKPAPKIKGVRKLIKIWKINKRFVSLQRKCVSR